MDIIKKINDLGYCVKFLANGSVYVSNKEIDIFINFYTCEFTIINNRAEPITIFNLTLLSLINTLLIECCNNKYERILKK